MNGSEIDGSMILYRYEDKSARESVQVTPVNA